jgi:hypothetical protein
MASDEIAASPMLVSLGRILQEEWSLPNARKTLKVNFEGVIAVTEAFWPLLRARPNGIDSCLLLTSPRL